MACSGCLALHGVNPNLKKKKKMYTNVMLILISINDEYLQNVVFSSEKGSNSQDYSSSDSHNPIKNLPCSKIFNCPHLGEFP